jgi:hypothetical protein
MVVSGSEQVIKVENGEQLSKTAQNSLWWPKMATLVAQVSFAVSVSPVTVSLILFILYFGCVKWFAGSMTV